MPERLQQVIADHAVRTVRLMACLPDGRLVGKYVAATHLAAVSYTHLTLPTICSV